MRYTRPFYCPRCQSQDRRDPFCAECRAPRLGRGGESLDYLVSEERAPSKVPWVIAPATLAVGAGLGWLFAGPVGAALLGAAGVDGWARRQFGQDWRRTRRAAKAARRDTAPVGDWLERLGDAPGRVAVRGRVRVAASAVTDDDACAAWTRRELEQREQVSYSLGGTVRDEQRWVRRLTRVGRFSVSDDSGVGWVDDDAVVVLPVAAPAEAPTETRIRTGDEVEVHGLAARAPMHSEAVDGAVDAYRTAADMLEFRGSLEQPLIVVRVASRSASAE